MEWRNGQLEHVIVNLEAKLEEQQERIDKCNVIDKLEHSDLPVQLHPDIVTIVKNIIRSEKNKVLVNAAKVRNIEMRAFHDGCSDFADRLLQLFDRAVEKPKKKE